MCVFAKRAYWHIHLLQQLSQCECHQKKIDFVQGLVHKMRLPEGGSTAPGVKKLWNSKIPHLDRLAKCPSPTKKSANRWITSPVCQGFRQIDKKVICCLLKQFLPRKKTGGTFWRRCAHTLFIEASESYVKRKRLRFIVPGDSDVASAITSQHILDFVTVACMHNSECQITQKFSGKKGARRQHWQTLCSRMWEALGSISTG